MYSSDKTKPFTTTNAVLAYCLYIVGVPFQDDSRPCRVVYSEEIIRRFVNGSGEPFYKGWELEKAIEHAWKNKKRGHIEYAFKQAPNLKRLLKAYQDQEEQLEKAEGLAKDVLRAIEEQRAEGKLDFDIAMMRSACVKLKMRPAFMSMWERMEPIVMYVKTGTVRRRREIVNTKHGPREAVVIDHPGYKGISLYASAETRKKVGL